MDTLNKILDVIEIRTWILSGYIFNVVGTWFKFRLSLEFLIFPTEHNYKKVLSHQDTSFCLILYIKSTAFSRYDGFKLKKIEFIIQNAPDGWQHQKPFHAVY